MAIEKRRFVTGSVTQNNTGTLVIFNSADALTYTLLPATGTGREETLINIGAGKVTVAPYDEDTILGESYLYLQQGGLVTIYDVGSEIWWKMDGSSEDESFYAITDPATSAATTAAIIDGYGGVVITTTKAANDQTLASPTVIYKTQSFKVINNDTSTNSVTVNGVIIKVGDSQTFLWDGTVWSDVDIGYDTDGIVLSELADPLTITPTADATGGQYAIKITDTSTFQAVAAHKSIWCELSHTPSSTGTACPIAIVGKMSLAGNNTASNSYPGLGWGVQGQVHIATGTTINGSTYGSPGAVYAGLRGVITGAGTSTYTKGHLCGLYAEIQLAQANANDESDFNIYGIYVRNQGVATSTDMAAGIYMDVNPSFPSTILKGIYIADTSVVQAIDIGSCTTGIVMTGVTAYALDIQTTGVVRMGIQGTGIPVSTTYPFGLEVQTETAADIVPGATGASAGIYSRYEVAEDQTTQCSHISMFGKLRVKKDLGDGTHAGVFGYVEISESGTVIGGTATTSTAAGHFAVEADANFELSTGHLSGVCVDSSVNDSATITGSFVGVRIKKTGSAKVWAKGIDIEDSTATTGISIGTCTTGINISGDCTTGVNIDGTMNYGIYINPTMTADTSMMPIRILYDYPGATVNTGVDMDCYGVRSAITQTTSNDDADIGDRGYIMGMRSDATVNGYIDDAYSLYARMTVAGTSVANQLYGLNSVFNHGAYGITMDESGNIAGVGVSMNGTGDVTCEGTGYGKVSGMYISWNETNAMTVDTCGVYLGVVNGATLDSGYRVNASGTLTNSFHSYNSSGTITTGLNFEGAHTTEISLQNGATIVNSTTGEVGITAAIDVADTKDGGASNGSIIKKTLQDGEAYTTTTAGLMVKNYGHANATVEGEYTGLYVNVKALHTEAGHDISLISAHHHPSSTQTCWAGLWLYGDMENGIKASGDSLTNLLDISEATAVTNLISLPAAGTDPVINNQLVPACEPTAATVGADACARVLVNGVAYYIALYDTLK